MKLNGRILGLSALALLAVGAPALADTVSAKGGSVSVDISAKQMSRIFVRDDKIIAARSLDDPNGPQLITQSDANTGDLYVGFDADAIGRSYSLFLTTQSGEVIQVLLKPTDIDPTSIEILEEHHRSQETTAPGVSKANGYAETIVAFEKLMFNGQTTDGVTYRQINDAGQETRHFLVRTLGYYHTDGLVGTVLSLTNHSTVPQELAPEQFLVRHVLAAGVSGEMVQPGEEVRVYIVEEAQ
jgi:conjugal transfer pilus assembly protein TraK